MEEKEKQEQQRVRVRVGTRNKFTAREGKNTMQHTYRSVTGAHTA